MDNDSEYFLREINDIFNSTDSHKIKFLRVFSLIKKLIGLIVESEDRYFPTFYSKMIFTNKFLDLNNDERSRLGNVRKFAGIIKKTPNIYLAFDDLNYALATLLILLKKVFQKGNFGDIDKKVNSETKLISYKNYFEHSELGFLSEYFLVKSIPEIIHLDKVKFIDISVVDDSSNEYTLRLLNNWINLYDFLWLGCKIYVKNVGYQPENKLLKCRHETFITLEPEHFLDVSEIAECFDNRGSNYNLYFLNRYFSTDKYFHLMLGNIVNRLFDELITDSDVDFTNAFNNALKSKPLTSIAVALEVPNAIQILKQKSAMQFESLKKAIQGFNDYYTSVEPSFVSVEYGIRGRLDLFLEDKNNQFKKTVIELKSGSAPAKNLTYTDENNVKYQTGIWQNHLIQVTCYNMLIDSVFENRTGDSCILYSSTDEFPLRDAPNMNAQKQAALMLRNQVISITHKLRRQNYELFGNFTLKDFGNRSSFTEKKIIEFSKFYNSKSLIDRDYFNFFTTFIEREIYQANLGDDTQQDSSSKISESFYEKQQSASSFTGLTVNSELSDFENFHLVFDISNEEIDVKTIRVGDIANLYTQFDSETVFAAKNQIFKCVIKEISDTQIKISLRNKSANLNLFDDNNLWIIELDDSDNLLKKMFASIFQFVKADNNFKKLIYGFSKPLFNQINDETDELLTHEQNLIVNKALAAKNYFLIQGPPGTGKTSFVLKKIAEKIHINSDENVLFMAYTNRAADEICKALLSINPKIDVIRLGSKESSEHHEILLSKYVENFTMNEVYSKLKSARFLVCTVSFAMQNDEIFKIKKFITAIIDEASQILEPQIVGLLSKFERFIMIGDEKQLPAVVTQNQNQKFSVPESLIDIGIESTQKSLFERLLLQSTRNNYDNFAMLSSQARMHTEIQEVANNLIYDNKLQSMNFERQSASVSIFHENSDNDLERKLARSRTVFFNSKFENGSKFNHYEAELVVKIIKLIIQKISETGINYSIGVIAPFRAQCSLIRNLIPHEYRNKITVDTVERYQGSERDIIIISTAVNYRYLVRNIESIATINDRIIDRKLNVAITRAKEHLIITGNASVLETSNSYSDLIQQIKNKKSFFNKTNF